MNKPFEDWLTTVEAAELANKLPEHIARACRRGHVIAKKRGRQWFVRRDSLMAYIDNPPLPGPKAKDEEE